MDVKTRFVLLADNAFMKTTVFDFTQYHKIPVLPLSVIYDKVVKDVSK